MSEALESLLSSFGDGVETVAAARLLLLLLLGGVLAFFVRMLYVRFSRSVSDRESFGAVFVPLTVATVLVIMVVKSSLALSLGLVGALSIVRFRAAIKDPEELVYLFFCIAIGLALGANSIMTAMVGLLVFTLFVIGQHRWKNKTRRHNLLLTISGDDEASFGGDATSVQQHVAGALGPYEIQRFEYEDGQVQLRATVSPESGDAITSMMADLQKKLPGCQLSYVNLDNLI
jgi:uncharacterized membrane protein YhiD involved in acid resistance